MSTEKGLQKKRVGIVVSDKMEKTVVVRLERTMQHSLYKKRIRKYRNVKVHDQKNESKVGDKVRIIETRPLSRDKRWRLEKILEVHKE